MKETFISINEWNYNKEVTCISFGALAMIKKALDDNADKFPSLKIKELSLCSPHFAKKVYYYSSDIAFTYLHLDKEGQFKALTKNFMRTEVFQRYAALADGRYRINPDSAAFILLENSWADHVRALPSDEDIEAKSIKVKVGAAVKSLLQEGAKEQEIALFCDLLMEEVRLAYANRYEVEVSDKPSAIYAMHSAFRSCMTDKRQETFEIYDAIPGIKIAYIKSQNLLWARALLHESTYYRKPIKIMDRIYFADSYYLAAMKRFAKDNGYWYKTAQALDWEEYTDGFGNKKRFAGLRIPTGDILHKFLCAPYIDTFYNLIEKDGKIYLGMRKAVGHKLAYIRLAAARHIPNILLDESAKACYICGELHRKKDLHIVPGFDKLSLTKRDILICKQCLWKVEPCKVCHELYVYVEHPSPREDCLSTRTADHKVMCQLCYHHNQWR